MSKQTRLKLAAASYRLIALLAVIALIAVVSSTVVSRAGDEPTDNKMSPDAEKEMAAWAAANQLGPMHEKLKMFEGKWKCVSKWYMAPGAPPHTSNAKAEYTLVYDGRYLHHEYEGKFEMPGPDGKMMSQKFQGTGTMGYDGMRKEFVSTWYDSMSTGIFMEHGQWNDTTKQFEFHGEMPAPDGKTSKTKSTLKFDGKDSFVMEMRREIAPGQFFKEMEIVFSRD